MKYALKLEMEWVPRSQNERADYISKIVDFDDWKVNPCLFDYLDGMWGPHTVDCFASYYNTQLSRYFSRYWNPGAEAVDAFTVAWCDEVCWWVPPLYLVMRVVKHARARAAKGTLTVPLWKSAPFWPVLCPDGIHLAGYVKQWAKLQVSPWIFQDGRSGNNIGTALPLILVFWHYSSISAVLIDQGKLGFVHLMTLAGVVTVH